MKIENRQQFLVVLAIAAVGLLGSVGFLFLPLGGGSSSRPHKLQPPTTNLEEVR